MNTPDFRAIAAQFDAQGVAAIALMGSFARNDAGTFSDVDIVRFHRRNDTRQAESTTHFIHGALVIVSDVVPSQIEDWFTKPEQATTCIAGLRSARTLRDIGGYFRAIQDRAHQFVWDEAMQQKANAYASSQMVGWIEEVHKGLEGLRRCDDGRLINARHGLSWGLTDVLRVQKGILISGDNSSYLAVTAALGERSEWVRLSRKSFAMAGDISLPDQVRAGLRLYVLTAEWLAEIFNPEERTLIEETVKRINVEL